MKENAAIIGERMPWTPSHGSYLSDFKFDELGTRSFSDSMLNGNPAKVPTSDKQDVIMNSKDEERDENSIPKRLFIKTEHAGCSKVKNERRSC